MLIIGSQINEIRIDGDLRRLKEDLDHFLTIGLEAAEIPPHGLDVIRDGRLDERRLQAVKKILDDYLFCYTVHAPNPLNLMDREHITLHREVMQATLLFAREIRAAVIVVHGGRHRPEETFPFFPQRFVREEEQERLMDLEAEELKKFADIYPDLMLAVENARPYLCHSPYSYAEDLRRLTSHIARIQRTNVRITLDCGHLFLSARFYDYDPLAAAAEAAPLVGHCHIHDNFGRAGYHHEKQQTHLLPFGKGDAHMPVGWGKAPLSGILERILPHYQGCLIMELRSRYFSVTEESRENLIMLLASIKTAPERCFPHRRHR